MIRKEGRIVPSVAMRQPFNPRNLFPIGLHKVEANWSQHVMVIARATQTNRASFQFFLNRTNRRDNIKGIHVYFPVYTHMNLSPNGVCILFKNSNNSLSHSINCWSIDIELDNFY